MSFQVPCLFQGICKGGGHVQGVLMSRELGMFRGLGMSRGGWVCPGGVGMFRRMICPWSGFPQVLTPSGSHRMYSLQTSSTLSTGNHSCSLLCHSHSLYCSQSLSVLCSVIIGLIELIMEIDYSCMCLYICSLCKTINYMYDETDSIGQFSKNTIKYTKFLVVNPYLVLSNYSHSLSNYV